MPDGQLRLLSSVTDASIYIHIYIYTFVVRVDRAVYISLRHARCIGELLLLLLLWKSFDW